MPTTPLTHALVGSSDLLNKHIGMATSCFDYNCVKDGTTNNSTAIQHGLDDLSAAGGGRFVIPWGDWGISYLNIPANITLEGYGPSSNLVVVANPPSGKGVINIAGTNSALHNLSITGRVTTPTTLNYSSFTDPEDTIISANSSVVVTGGTGFRMRKVWVSHTGGYAVWLDARTADISGALIEDCDFSQCRPFLFTDGVNTGGSWMGGIYYGMDGASALYSVKGLRVHNSHFRRISGNCVWGHSLGFNSHHKNVLITNCSFEDIGLDGTQHGNVMGGGVHNCTFHRIGYITHTDTDTPTPAYVDFHWGVAIDSSGYVSACTYSGNTATSVNGGFIDLDGFRDGIVSDNVCLNPASTDPEYTTDSLSTYGLGGTGNRTIGIQTGNTSQNGGGVNVSVTSNTVNGAGTSAIVMAYAKGCLCRGNRIKHPSTSSAEPIQIYSTTGGSPASERLATDTVVEDNYIDYTGARFCVAETGAGWTSSLINYVFNNRITGSNNGEVKFASASGSSSGQVYSTNDRTVSSVSQSIWQREGVSAAAALKHYTRVGSTQNQTLQLGDVGPLLNVSTNGDPGSGAVTTGPITSLGFYDAVATRRVLSIGGFIGMKYDTAFDTAADSTTLDAASMNPATWALLRYNPSVPTIEYSVATDSGANRIWQNLVSTPTVAGSVKQVQFNNGGSFGASSNFTFDTSTKQLTVLGAVATASIVAGSGYVQSDGGYLVTSSNTAADSIQTSGGVKAGLGQFLRTDSANPALIVSPDTNASWTNGFGAMYLRRQGSYTGSHLRFVTGSVGAVGVGAAPGANIWGFGQDTNAAFSPSLLSIDPTNLRVGIGTPTPSYSAHIKGTGQTDLVLETTAGGGVSAAMSVSSTDVRIGGITNNDVNFYWNNTVAATIHLGVFSFAGLAANPGLKVAAGYIDSAEGFNTASTAPNCIQALSGGAWAKLLTTDTALYPKTLGSPPAAPGGGYGGFYHRGGSQFGYYDAGAWHSVDFAASGSGVTMTQDVRNFGITCNGSTDDTAAWTALMASVTGTASFFIPSMSAISNSHNLGSAYIPGCPGSPYAFAIPSNVTLWGPGGFIGLDPPNSYEATTQIAVMGVLDVSGGSIVTSGSSIARNTGSFSLTNSYAVDDMLVLRNFPTDAGGSDAPTTDPSGTLSYAGGIGPNNLRQNRRLEPCQVHSASGGAFSLYAPCVYGYASTQGLQFQRVLPASNVCFDGLSMSNVYTNVTLARNFSLKGGHYKACTLNVDRSMLISVFPTEWDCEHTDSTVAIGTGSRFFDIRGNYFGGSATADNAVIRLDQCSNGTVDANVSGQVGGSSFYACIVDWNFEESYYGYKGMENVDLNVKITCSNYTHSVFVSGDPFWAPVENSYFEVISSGTGCQFQAGGMVNCVIDHKGPDGNLYVYGLDSVTIRGTAEYIFTTNQPDSIGVHSPKVNQDLTIDGLSVFPTGTGGGAGYPSFNWCVNLDLSAFFINMIASLDTSGQAAFFGNCQNVSFGQVRVSRTTAKNWGNSSVTGIIRVLGDLDGVPFSAGWPNPICVVPAALYADGGTNFPAFINWQTDTTTATAKGLLVAQNTGGGAGEIGMGSLSNHPLSIKQFNTNAIYVNTGRLVGITTTNPTYLFQAHDGAARGYSDIAATSATVTTRMSTAEAGGGAAIMGSVSNHPLYLRVNDNNQIQLTTDGATVFFGHSAPGAPASGAGGIYSDASGDLYAYNRGASRWDRFTGDTLVTSVKAIAGSSSYCQMTNAQVRAQSQTAAGTFAVMTIGQVNIQTAAGGYMSLSPSNLIFGANQVLTTRQTGPANTTDTTDVANKFNLLLTALRTHGLIT